MLKELIKVFGFNNESDKLYTSNEYYNYLEKYENYHTLLNFLNSENFSVLLNTKVNICLKNIVHFGMKSNQVKKIIGKPAWLFQCNTFQRHEIYFYKWMLEGYRAKVELHFYNNTFFMGVVYFDNYSQSNYNKIIVLILTKYKITNDNLAISKQCIIDTDKNFILLDNGSFGLTLTYFSGDKNILHNLLEQLYFLETKIIEKEKRKYTLNSILINL